MEQRMETGEGLARASNEASLLVVDRAEGTGTGYEHRLLDRLLLVCSREGRLEDPSLDLDSRRLHRPPPASSGLCGFLPCPPSLALRLAARADLVAPPD